MERSLAARFCWFLKNSRPSGELCRYQARVASLSRTLGLNDERSRPGRCRQSTSWYSRIPWMAPGVVEREATRIRRAASEASVLPLASSITSTSASPPWAMSWAIASLKLGLIVRTSEASSSLLRSRS